MVGMQQRAINLISKSPQLRPTPEIDVFLPWLRKKSQLFESIERHLIIAIIRGCQYKHVERDHVIIRQEEKGDCFYFILNGTVSVFIDTRKTGEENVEGAYMGQLDIYSAPDDKNEVRYADVDDEAVDLEVKMKKRPLDRSVFGKFMVKFETGRSFGEIALISDDSVRNASIIADERTDLLVIHRDLYNQTLKTYQEQEYRERRDFAQTHPLFRSWNARFRHLLEMSLIKEVFTYDTPIIRQGEPLNGLIFITKGRAKVQVAPNKHAAQYPEMKPFKSFNDVYEIEFKRTTRNPLENKKQRTQQSLKQELVALRRSEGYAAAEKKVLFKNITLCSVEAGEVIGDIETVMGMDTHLQTVICTAETEVYYLTLKNYERLITKKNPDTLDDLKMLVIRKLKSRATSKQGSQIPLLKHILFKLTEEIKPVGKKIPQLRASKELPEREALFNHLLPLFVRNKAQLIEPYVPGSIYLREIMRERARVRYSVQKHTKRTEPRSMFQGSLKQVQWPRTSVALRNDLERQVAQLRELENKWLLEELRAEERLQLQNEFQRLKLLPNINKSLKDLGPPEAEEPVRLNTAERLAAERLAAKEANGETAKQYGVFELTEVRDRHSIDTEIPASMVSKAVDINVISPASRIVSSNDLAENKNEDEKVVNITNGNQHSQFVITSGKGKHETLSNKELRVIQPVEQSRRAVESFNAMACESAYSVTEILHPAVPVAFRSLQGSLSDLRQSKTSLTTITSSEDPGLKCASQLVRSKLHLNYENPEYRDWETSDKTLGHLEERIRNFALSPVGGQTLKPIQPPRLARFERGDEAPAQPRPGGRVVIRRRPCPIQGRIYNMPNHRHTRYQILPTIPQYDQIKKAKMLAYMTIDEKRHVEIPQIDTNLDGIY